MRAHCHVKQPSRESGLGPAVKITEFIIPLALTRPEYPGASLVQGGVDHPPIRRWTSWYDDRLVTRSGEDRLASISHLRRLDASDLVSTENRPFAYASASAWEKRFPTRSA